MTARNLRIFVGESTSFSGVVQRQDGSRVDLTDFTLTWKAGDKDFKRTAISLTEGDGISITNVTRGEWQIDLRQKDTEELSRGLYVHEGFAACAPKGENLSFVFGKLTLDGIIK